MNEIAKALQPEARGQAFAFGLNPYGLTYHLGLQGAGGPRANPKGAGLDGFIAIATELGASVLEIYDPWLRALSDDELRALRDRLAALSMTPIVSSGLMMGPFESALRSARILDAKVIRHGLTTVLCGDRHALGEKWKELVAEVRAALADRGPRAADEGRILAIENHQDFGSDELAEFCETTRGVGICLDTGNTFPVAEAPLDFVAPRRAPCAARPSQGLPRAVHRRGLSPGALRHRRRRRPDGGDAGHPGGAGPEAERGARAGRARGAARAVSAAGMVELLCRPSPRRRSPPASPPRGSIASPTTPTIARRGSAARIMRSPTTNST